MAKKLKKEIDIPSQFTIIPACGEFPGCGGCLFQDADYNWELSYKEQKVLNLLKDANVGFHNGIYEGITAAPSVLEYRNKMEFTFGDECMGGSLQLGMRKRGSFYEVCDGAQCVICDGDFRIITGAVRDYFRGTGEAFYHKSKRTGTLRNVVIRKAFFTGEILVNIVTTGGVEMSLGGIAGIIAGVDCKGVVKGVLHTVCESVADVVKPESVTVIYGQPYISEELLGLRFKISPFSFFQTNSAGASLLYGTVREFAGDTGGKVIYDLYCGTGTITQILSRDAKAAVGVEIVGESVDAARENALENRLSNCEFITGDVLKELDSLHSYIGAGKPDMIILDPPREGVHPKAVGKIADFEAREIIYVSCNPSSLVRDLPVFINRGYVIKRVRCHDMFPRTKHIECVCLLTK